MSDFKESSETNENSFQFAVSLKIYITEEDIDDIMCSALEGGICYWCRRAEVVGDYLAKYGHEQISRGGTLLLHDLEDGTVHELDRDKLLQGLQLFIQNSNGNMVNIRNNRIDPGEFDGTCADCVVQYAVFGKIIYS